jgi:hypothetical protein
MSRAVLGGAWPTSALAGEESMGTEALAPDQFSAKKSPRF